MTKKSVWYEVIYHENSKTYHVLSHGKREAKELHKSHPGSTFKIIK